MVKENATVSICANPDQVQKAVVDLERYGFDIKRISVIGKAYGEKQELAAYYKQGDKLKCWGKQSDFWNRLCILIRDWIFFSCPGTGALLVIGPVSLWIIAVLDNSSIFGGLSVLGATLYSMGLAKDSVQDYEEALRKGSYLLIVHGPSQEVMQAKRILKSVDTGLPHEKNLAGAM
jgi:hypothetical protein